MKVPKELDLEAVVLKFLMEYPLGTVEAMGERQEPGEDPAVNILVEQKSLRRHRVQVIIQVIILPACQYKTIFPIF